MDSSKTSAMETGDSDDEYFLNSMSDFINFVWKDSKPSCARSFKHSLKASKEQSYVWKSFKNQFEVNHLIDEETIKEVKNGTLRIDNVIEEACSEKSQLAPKFTLANFMPIGSSLTKKDMKACFGIYLDLCQHKKLNDDKFEIYSVFKDIIEKEQEQYLNVAKNAWETNKTFEKVNFVSPEVMAYTSKLWKERVERLNWYPKMYRHITDISLLDESVKSKDSEFLYVGNLKIIGNSPFIICPQKKSTKINIYSELTNINFEKDSLKEVENSYKPVHPTFIQKGYHPEVSKDKIAISLATRKNAQVVMSESAFLRLFEVHKEVFSSPWILPVDIKELDDFSGHKIVFIDKALPPWELSAAQRNKWFCKKMMPDILENHRLSETNRHADIRRERQRQARRRTHLDDVDDDLDKSLDKGTFGKLLKPQKGDESGTSWSTVPVKSEDLENFLQPGCSSDDATPEKPEINKNTNMSEDELSDCQSDQLFIDEQKEQLIDEQMEEDKSPQRDTSDKSDKVSFEPNIKKGTSAKNHKTELSIQFQPVKTDYNLWTFKSEQKSVLMKDKLEDINVIIRCKNTSKSKVNVRTKNQVITTKFEYQPAFGAEVMSLNELTQDWCKVFIRPKSQLLRIRVDPVSGDIIMPEIKNLNDLNLDIKRLYQYDPQDRFKYIHSVLQSLLKQPPGHYLLKRTANNGLFAQLCKADEKHGNELINLNYINIDFNKLTLSRHNYLRIDTMTITPLFKFSKRIPATFHARAGQLRSRLANLSIDTGTAEPKAKKNNNTKKKRKAKSQKSPNKSVNNAVEDESDEEFLE